VSKKFWDSLPPADQTILRDAAVETRAFQRGIAREQAKSAEANMANKGLLINDITPAERKRMRDQVKPVWDMFAKDVGVDLVTEVTGQLSTK
jgi:TRAP-type C4-dicarboxylate transport system substrate-binding protein